MVKAGGEDERYRKVGGVVLTSLVTHTMFTRGYAYSVQEMRIALKSCRALVQNMPADAHPKKFQSMNIRSPACSGIKE